MTKEEQAKYVVLGIISEAPQEQRAKIEAALATIREVAKTEEGKIALGLAALELAAS